MTKQHIILVAGAPRSGSTWCFNAIRLLLLRNSKEVYAAWCEDYDPEYPSVWRLVKAHKQEQVQFEPSFIVTSYRDVCERIASQLRMGWGQDDPEWIVKAAENQTKLYEYWKKRSDFEVHYDDILRKPAEAVAQLAHALRLSSKKATEIAAELNALQPPAGGRYDGTTLLHPNHIGERQETTRKADEIRALLLSRDRCGFEKRGANN